MKSFVKVLDVKTISEIDGVWSNENYIELLERLDFSDADKLPIEELQ